jgi:hypothetical protein
MPRWSNTRVPQAAISTAELVSGIGSTVPASAAASCGSAFWRPAAARPQSACDSRFPPASVARFALPVQFEGVPPVGVADWKLPATIEPSIRASGDGAENHSPPVAERARLRASVTPRRTIGCRALPITARPAPPQAVLLKIVVSSIVSVVPEVALSTWIPPPRWLMLAPAWLPSIRLARMSTRVAPKIASPPPLVLLVPPVIRTRSKVAERVLPTKTFPPGSSKPPWIVTSRTTASEVSTVSTRPICTGWKIVWPIPAPAIVTCGEFMTSAPLNW